MDTGFEIVRNTVKPEEQSQALIKYPRSSYLTSITILMALDSFLNYMPGYKHAKVTRRHACKVDRVPLSDEELKGVKESLEDVKNGRVVTLDQVKDELNL